MPRWTLSMMLAAALAAPLAGCTGTTAQDPLSSAGATGPEPTGSVRTITSSDVDMPPLSSPRAPSSADAMRIVSLATGVGVTLAALDDAG